MRILPRFRWGDSLLLLPDGSHPSGYLELTWFGASIAIVIFERRA